MKFKVTKSAWKGTNPAEETLGLTHVFQKKSLFIKFFSYILAKINNKNKY